VELFENKVDALKFKSTNYLWNRLRLNHPWTVGYVSSLIESKPFSTKEEWKEYYYRSGEERLKIIHQQCTEEQKKSLFDFKNPNPFLPKELKTLNLYYGRTEEELNKVGEYMYEKILEEGNPYHITLGECIYMVKFRVIGETWNGIIMREQNTIKTLKKAFPTLSFKKVDGEKDFKYAIDYELYEGEKLLCAIQIKPISYKKGYSKEIVRAKMANEAKNNKYREDFHADVFYIYSDSRGNIENTEVLSQIRYLSFFKKSILTISNKNKISTLI
jgi:hypothetical protein